MVDGMFLLSRSIWMASFTSLLFLTLVTMVGLISYAYYATCDPLLSKKIDKLDQVDIQLTLSMLGPDSCIFVPNHVNSNAEWRL